MDKITSSLTGMNFRQALNFGLIVASALIIWKTMMLVSNTESPIVVVLSESMYPAFTRGDLLFLWWRASRPVEAGDVLVYHIPNRVPNIPIVHRALSSHQDVDGQQKILTKGDANPVDDRGLYNRGQLWVQPEHVIGRVRAYLPYVGIVTILMNDYPSLKFVLIGGLFLMVVLGRDDGK